MFMLYLVAFIITIILYQAGVITKAQLVLNLILLPILPLYLFVLVAWNAIKFGYHMVFEKW